MHKQSITGWLWLILVALASVGCLGVLRGRAWAVDPSHAIAMHGEPALAADFSHFRYVNPDAPKGGRFTQAVVGTFDSLNPFIVRGLPADGMRGYVIESLMVRGYDEPFTLYSLLAQTIETDTSRRYVTFELNPAAAFSDGSPVTADDVIAQIGASVLNARIAAHNAIR